MEFIRVFYTFILSLRYNVKIVGLDLLSNDESKLILPNHISHIDPQLMSLKIYKYTDFVPLVAERFFKIPIIKFILRNLEAVRVPEYSKGKKEINLMESINTGIIEALNNNKSAMIFPSGQLSTGGVERIVNKQSTYSVMQILPDHVQVVGVRITGLWGSMWSKAWNGHRPDFFKTFLKGIGYFILNLFFLMPRRKVTMEFVDLTKEAKLQAQSDRKSFNLYLENFYNANGPEEPYFVRHLFYFPRIKNKVVVA